MVACGVAKQETGGFFCSTCRARALSVDPSTLTKATQGRKYGRVLPVALTTGMRALARSLAQLSVKGDAIAIHENLRERARNCEGTATALFSEPTPRSKPTPKTQTFGLVAKRQETVTRIQAVAVLSGRRSGQLSFVAALH